MKKKILFLGLITVMSLSLSACNNKVKESTKDESVNQTKVSEKASDENKMIVGEKTGTGKVNLVNESGSTENENILYVMYKEDMILMQLGLESEDMDGTKPTIIYLDGEELIQEQLGDSQGSIELKEKALEKGIHNVEFIQKDGKNATFYHIAKYEVK